ncbi:MAG: RidA family protein [Pirellulales bacterium]|nr:RidA family protein [Pirellulales bacterium]
MKSEERLVERLARLGLEMPEAAEPKGLYRPVLIVDDLAYTSGHLPVTADGQLITGRVGDDLDVDGAQQAALLAGLGILATLKAELGSLDRVRRVVKLLGMVNCTAGFTQQPAVINGASQLLADVFGEEKGIGARSAFGVGSLPLGVPVEIEAIFEIEH